MKKSHVTSQLLFRLHATLFFSLTQTTLRKQQLIQVERQCRTYYPKHDLIINSRAVLQDLCEKPVRRMWITIYIKYKPGKYPRVVSYISVASHALADCSSIEKQTEGIQRGFSPGDYLEVLIRKKKMVL